MEQLKHSRHDHLLHLVHMQQNIKNENSDEEKEEENEDEDEFVEETQIFGECNMCREPIYSFQLCYYECKECDYSLHRFCAELPETLENHPSHPGHNVDLKKFHIEHSCHVCHRTHGMFFWYYCSICYFQMDIVCVTISEQKMDHPSHPHQLQRVLQPMVSRCHACGDEHKGTFYQCTTCSPSPTPFWIHVDCALLPEKLRIEHTTSGTFTHIHPLTLAYSFPLLDQKARFYPHCRVCGGNFRYFMWHYKCDKCWYYTHVDCATSKKDAFMAIFLSQSRGKTSKNFEDNDHPNLLRLPFLDESDNLLKHHFFNQKDLKDETNDGEILNHASHQHPLILFDTSISLADKSLSLHNPMKRNQLLCDGCLRPIITVPFYKCSQDADQQCGFVLHKWCARLPAELHDHPSHPKHTLSLMPKVPDQFFGVFECRICQLPSNGFAYGCTTCKYYVDINCAFLPEEITHEAHPNHLLSRIDPSVHCICKACKTGMSIRMGIRPMAFHCRSCDFYVHIECALLLPRMIRHKSDKRHTLNLRYSPAENHSSEYFCDICEDEFDPTQWFYHCSICDQSMHAACAPLILQNEQSTSSMYFGGVFKFINVKFGGTLDMMDHHPHRLTFVQGIQSDGRCIRCREKLQYEMIFKCMECDFAIHHSCPPKYFIGRV